MCTGIILAGGKSRRMNGVDKGLIPFNGKPMIEHVISALKPVVDEVIIIANSRGYEPFGLPIYPDIVQEKGPLGGLLSGLTQSKSDDVIIVGCDMPFVENTIFTTLQKYKHKYDIVIPKTPDGIQPLCGLYKKKCIPVIHQLIEENQLKMTHLFNQMNTYFLPFKNKTPFFNMNSPEDIKSGYKLKETDL